MPTAQHVSNQLGLLLDRLEPGDDVAQQAPPGAICVPRQDPGDRDVTLGFRLARAQSVR